MRYYHTILTYHEDDLIHLSVKQPAARSLFCPQMKVFLPLIAMALDLATTRNCTAVAGKPNTRDFGLDLRGAAAPHFHFC